jgi:hypothetical protein
MTSRRSKKATRRRCHLVLPVNLVAQTRKLIAPLGVTLSAHVATLMVRDLEFRATARAQARARVNQAHIDADDALKAG